jgi:hypothetical protein
MKAIEAVHEKLSIDEPKKEGKICFVGKKTLLNVRRVRWLTLNNGSSINDVMGRGREGQVFCKDRT